MKSIFKIIIHILDLLQNFFKVFYFKTCGPVGSGGKALDYGVDGPGSNPGVGGVEVFLYSFVSRLVLESTQPPKNEYRGFSLGVKGVKSRISHPTSF